MSVKLLCVDWSRLVVRGRLVRSRLVGRRLVSRGGNIKSRSRDIRSRGRSVRSGCGGIRSRGIGRLAVSRVGSFTSVHNISNVTTVIIGNIVVNSLQATVRESHRVGARSAIAITLLLMTELVAIVVIYGIVESIGRSFIGWLLVGRVGRSIGRSWGITILGCIRCWGSSSQSNQGDGDERLNKKLR
jgi:hypothetical protein